MTANWQDKIILAVPSVDGGHLLKRMLPTLRFKPSNVLVLDQGSSDDTTSVCKAAGVELLQLGRPHTYTQACNISARIARQRGYPYLCVANNDIVFCTDVLSELLSEMERDPKLGIVAPSQVILDPPSGVDVLARRAYWKLDTVEFLHDLDGSPALPRMEADFCELTCALIRVSAIKEVGFLDDAYGFYHEDADFCYRLRKAGYGAAYLSRSQICHFTSSTFSSKRQEQIDYLRRNRIYFARTHLGYGIRQPRAYDTGDDETEVAARRLFPLLLRFGLIDDHRPDLTTGRIGAATSDYLLTTQRAPVVPEPWLGARDRYRAILATSSTLAHTLRAAGFVSFHVPLGIDPDLFNPWGPLSRRFDETTYLAVAHPYDSRPLANLLQAWTKFASGRKVRLIVVGSRLQRRMGRAADISYRSGTLEISCYAPERLELHETKGPLADEELALLYRSVDFTIIAAAEGSSLTLTESLACGTPVVFDASCTGIKSLYCDVTGDLTVLEACASQAQPCVGGPTTTEGLVAALERSAEGPPGGRKEPTLPARYGVLSHSTLRHTAMALRHVLEMTQEREPERVVRRLEAASSAPDETYSPPTLTPLRARLSGAAARRLTTVATLAAGFGTQWQHAGLRSAVTRTAARMVRDLPPAIRSRSSAHIVTKSRNNVARRSSPLLIGYIDAQLGIGQSLRGLAFAMAEAKIPFSIYPFGIGVEGRRSVPTMPERYDEVTPHNINIIEVSPAELPRVFSHVSGAHFEGSYNILRTYWELAKGPAIWRQGHDMDRIHEIWAPNAFCATAFRDFFDGPIVIVPPCLQIARAAPETALPDKKRFGLNPDIFYFLFSFDYHSYPERKNPLAVIRAFRTAFPDFDCPIGLIVKATSAEGHFPAVKQEIIAAAQADGRIVIIDTSLSQDDMISLMASVDCYVSLHRSEGFGLGMAEALALEKPVIATGYSGNCEFLTEQTGYPIPFTLQPVRPHEYVHAAGQVWADPDENACVAMMRHVVEHPDEAALRARTGRIFVEAHYGPANVGQLVAERLAEIRRLRSLVSPH